MPRRPAVPAFASARREIPARKRLDTPPSPCEARPAENSMHHSRRATVETGSSESMKRSLYSPQFRCPAKRRSPPQARACGESSALRFANLPADSQQIAVLALLDSLVSSPPPRQTSAWLGAVPRRVINRREYFRWFAGQYAPQSLPSTVRPVPALSPRSPHGGETVSELSWQILRFHFEEPSDNRCRLLPILGLDLQLLTSFPGQSIEARPAIIL